MRQGSNELQIGKKKLTRFEQLLPSPIDWHPLEGSKVLTNKVVASKRQNANFFLCHLDKLWPMCHTLSHSRVTAGSQTHVIEYIHVAGCLLSVQEGCRGVWWCSEAVISICLKMAKIDFSIVVGYGQIMSSRHHQTPLHPSYTLNRHPATYVLYGVCSAARE